MQRLYDEVEVPSTAKFNDKVEEAPAEVEKHSKTDDKVKVMDEQTQPTQAKANKKVTLNSKKISDKK